MKNLDKKVTANYMKAFGFEGYEVNGGGFGLNQDKKTVVLRFGHNHSFVTLECHRNYEGKLEWVVFIIEVDQSMSTMKLAGEATAFITLRQQQFVGEDLIQPWMVELVEMLEKLPVPKN